MIPIFHQYTGFMMGEHRAFFEKVMERDAFIKFLVETQKEDEGCAQKIAKEYYANNISKLSFF
jgi:hypothetical protein